MFVNTKARFGHAFNLIYGMGPSAYRKLFSHFGSLEKAWFSELNELRLAGLDKSLIEQIRIKRPGIDPDLEMEKLNKHGLSLITLEDEDYPKLLKEIYSPPAVLYIKGKFQPSDKFSLAVVGTRRPSFYGRQITPQLTADLSRYGLTIVSGLAKGIDTLAHSSAISNSGRTIAVLGSGLDKESIYPSINRTLAEKISENGAVVSEFPPGTMARPQHFPQRNRIISGLSLGVLVIEAPLKSGALITAKDALEQNRDVFAVPGSILWQNSLGTNELIKMGAKLVSEADDIIQELNLNSPVDKFQKTQKILPDNQEESLILEHLSSDPLHIDKIIMKSKLPANIVNSTVSLMEIKGKVKNLGGNNYVLSR